MNVAIVGGGSVGTKIFEFILNIEDINVKIVIDTNLNAPGMLLAKKTGIQYSQSIDDISNNKIDMIIEATGVDKVKNIIHENFDDKCKIVDSGGAYLVIALVEKNMETVKKIHRQIEIVNEASNTVQEQLSSITSSIEKIHMVSKKLSSVTKNSNNYINETDAAIENVHKIAQQVKILGLNATIEASRAGKHGKGFSVVAKEIQKLSTSSKEFSDKIQSILIKLSSEVKKINSETNILEDLSGLQLQASESVSATVEDLKEKTIK